MGAIPTIVDIILLYSQVDKAPVKNFLVFCEVILGDMAELADAQHSKCCEQSCGFDSHYPH